MAKSISLFAAAVAAAAVFSGCSKVDNSLIMITEAGFPPYEYDEGGKIVGVDVEICQAVAAKLGRPLVVQDAKFDAVIPSVVAGKADFAAAGITVTEDRKQSVDFSVPYVTSGIVIVSRKGEEYKTVDEVKGKRIGVQSGTTSDNFCVETVGQEPERFDAPPTAAAALVAGKVDALIVDIDPAKNIVKGTDAILISSDFLTKEEFAVAIRKGQPEILAAMNEVIEALVKEGKIEAWKAEYDARYAALRAVEEKAAEEVKPALGAITEKLSGAVSEGAAAVVDTAKAATEKVAEGVVAAKDAVVDVAKDATEKAAEGAAAVKDAVVDTAKAATEKVAEGAAAVKDAVVDTAKAATEKVSEGAAAVKDAVADTAKAAAEKTEAVVEKTAEEAVAVKDAAADTAKAAAEKTEAVAEKAAEEAVAVRMPLPKRSKPPLTLSRTPLPLNNLT